MLATPFFGELAVKGVFKQGLAVLLDLLRCSFQTAYALVDFVKQAFDFINDGLLGFFAGWVDNGVISNIS